MAELLIKIGTSGPDPAPQDGDIVCAFGPIEIREQAFRYICGPRRIPAEWRTATGEIRRDSPCFRYYRSSMTRMVEALSANEIRVTDLTTGATTRREFDARSYVAGRRRRGSLIWGTAARPVWFGGHSREVSTAAAAMLWNHIETATAHRRDQHRRWKWGTRERRTHLVLPMRDVPRARLRELAEPETATVPDPTFDPADRLDADDGMMVETVQFRRHDVPWRDLGVPETEARIRDPQVDIDVRESMEEILDTVARRKPRRGPRG